MQDWKLRNRVNNQSSNPNTIAEHYLPFFLSKIIEVMISDSGFSCHGLRNAQPSLIELKGIL